MENEIIDVGAHTCKSLQLMENEIIDFITRLLAEKTGSSYLGADGILWRRLAGEWVGRPGVQIKDPYPRYVWADELLP
jgi:hypothetical protein